MEKIFMVEKQKKTNNEKIIHNAYKSICSQAAALEKLATEIDNEFVLAINFILTCSGRLVISGMGKSGHIGRKLAASLASTGTRAFFIHPGEAFHGDLGMIAPEDVVLLISNSGETNEILQLIPTLKHFGNKIISIHGDMKSTLADNSDVNLLVKVDREVCPHNLAPTTSTLAVMAMGDALMVSLMGERNFQPEDFAKFHPGGSLGRKLLRTVAEEMRSYNLPLVEVNENLRACLLKITTSRTGIAFVVEGGRLVGVITDGDIRRILLEKEESLSISVKHLMNEEPVTISPEKKVAEAEELLKTHKIKALAVVQDDIPIGLFEA